MFARSSITFHNDDGISDASPPSPPVSTQMSGKSMKSMTLDDDATASTVHYVPGPSGDMNGCFQNWTYCQTPVFG